MFQFLESLLLKKKLRERSGFELKYFEKYKNLVVWNEIIPLFEEYKSGDIIFEPIRLKITEQDEERLYDEQLEDLFLNAREYLDQLDYMISYRVSWKDYRERSATLPRRHIKTKDL